MCFTHLLKTLLLENPKTHDCVYWCWWTQPACSHISQLWDNFNIILLYMHESQFQEFPPKQSTHFWFTLVCYMFYQFNPCPKGTVLGEMYKLWNKLTSLRTKYILQAFTFTSTKWSPPPSVFSPCSMDITAFWFHSGQSSIPQESVREVFHSMIF